LGQSSGLGAQGLHDAGVRIYLVSAARPHYVVLCLLKGSLLGGRGEVLKARSGSSTTTSTVTSLPVLVR
jgi:hypothetical protein